MRVVRQTERVESTTPRGLRRSREDEGSGEGGARVSVRGGNSTRARRPASSRLRGKGKRRALAHLDMGSGGRLSRDRVPGARRVTPAPPRDSALSSFGSRSTRGRVKLKNSVFEHYRHPRWEEYHVSRGKGRLHARTQEALQRIISGHAARPCAAGYPSSRSSL